jgi:hypothetical protein
VVFVGKLSTEGTLLLKVIKDVLEDCSAADKSNGTASLIMSMEE